MSPHGRAHFLRGGNPSGLYVSPKYAAQQRRARAAAKKSQPAGTIGPPAKRSEPATNRVTMHKGQAVPLGHVRCPICGRPVPEEAYAEHFRADQAKGNINA